MYNRVILIGHLGADPETRHNQSGDPICNLRLATSETWKDRNTGERKERTAWHRIVVFNKSAAGFAQQYCRKGDMIQIEGRIQYRTWTDQKGIERYSTDIVVPAFGGELKKLNKSDDQRGQTSGGRTQQVSSQERAQPVQNELDDEIPF